MTPPGPRVVVVGGGIGGLTAALDLARAGLAPLVLDAGPTPGGVVCTHTVGGLTLDAGAESFAVARPATAALIDELGLTDRVVAPAPVGAWVRHAGGAAPLPATAYLGIPGHPWAADVRRIVGWPGAARTLLDRVRPIRDPAPGPNGSPDSLGSLVRARMGRRVLERLVEPVAGGVYAADPDTLDLGIVAPGLPAALRRTGSLAAAARELRGGGGRPGSAVASLTGGLHTLVPTLVAAVTAAGGTIRSGVRVTGLTRAGGWRLATDAGGITADRLVLALPGPAAGPLLAGPDARIGPAALVTDVFGEPVSPVALVTLVVDDAGLDAAPRGTGVLVSARASGPRAKALTHATAKWPWLAAAAGPGRHVLRLSYGRGPDDRLPADADLPGLALADAADLLGRPIAAAALVDADVVRWTAALPVPRPGHAAAVTALRSAAGPPGLAVVGAAVAGTGLGAVIADARAQTRTMIDA
ncbi:protoporphyrinogen/coproporphyrinogen oxidase [Nakamurella sp.]|uniref:protoporphyrinogen/coproporphyrinogen oxidase n=1 Tax=Nakamurella sp. TaxID=1869182 RepID=UPI003B3B3917